MIGQSTVMNLLTQEHQNENNTTESTLPHSIGRREEGPHQESIIPLQDGYTVLTEAWKGRDSEEM